VEPHITVLDLLLGEAGAITVAAIPLFCFTFA
jgi:hypothetical protein